MCSLSVKKKHGIIIFIIVLLFFLHMKSSHFNRNVCDHEFPVRQKDSHKQILQCSTLVTWFHHIYIQKVAWFWKWHLCELWFIHCYICGNRLWMFFINISYTVTSLLHVGCGVCKRMQPIFQQAATETKGKYVSALLACQNHGLLILLFPFFFFLLTVSQYIFLIQLLNYITGGMFLRNHWCPFLTERLVPPH